MSVLMVVTVRELAVAWNLATVSVIRTLERFNVRVRRTVGGAYLVSVQSLYKQLPSDRLEQFEAWYEQNVLARELGADEAPPAEAD